MPQDRAVSPVLETKVAPDDLNHGGEQTAISATGGSNILATVRDQADPINFSAAAECDVTADGGRV